MTDFDAHATDLVEANVDPLRVGRNWPTGLAQLIEAHEQKHHGLVVRKQMHVLIDRYVERYFPGVVVEYKHRRIVIQLLRRRYYDRFNRYFHDLVRVRNYVGTSAPIGRQSPDIHHTMQADVTSTTPAEPAKPLSGMASDNDRH